MARPKGADSEQTHDRILEAASSELQARGVEGLALRNVAKAAGVSASLVIHYFTNKDGLIKSMLDAYEQKMQGLHRQLVEIVQNDSDFETSLADVLRTSYRFLRQNRHLVRFISGNSSHQGDDAPMFAANWGSEAIDFGAAWVASNTSYDPKDCRVAFGLCFIFVSRLACSIDQERDMVLRFKDEAHAEKIAIATAMRILLAEPTSPKTN